MGYVTLAGVVVNNSILLVDFIKHEHAEGVAVATARAVFPTTSTPVAGLIPIPTETSLQAQILVPLVASLVPGLVAAYAVVIPVLPAVHATPADFASRRLNGAGPCAARSEMDEASP